MSIPAYYEHLEEGRWFLSRKLATAHHDGGSTSDVNTTSEIFLQVLVYGLPRTIRQAALDALARVAALRRIMYMYQNNELNVTYHGIPLVSNSRKFHQESHLGVADELSCTARCPGSDQLVVHRHRKKPLDA